MSLHGVLEMTDFRRKIMLKDLHRWSNSGRVDDKVCRRPLFQFINNRNVCVCAVTNARFRLRLALSRGHKSSGTKTWHIYAALWQFHEPDGLAAWLVFNDPFSANRLYRAIGVWNIRRTSRLEQYTRGYPCWTRHYAFQEHY